MQMHIRLATLFPIAISLCAAGPPPKGAEARLHAGTGSFEYGSGGCGGPTYANRATEFSGFARVTARHGVGATAAVEGTLAHAKTNSSRLIDAGDSEDPAPRDEDEIGRKQRGAAGAIRAGYHHQYFGLEAGLFTTVGLDDVLPSAEGWIGLPRIAYVWGAFLAGPAPLSDLPVEFGLGHASERVRVDGSYSPLNASVGLGVALRPADTIPFYAGIRLRQSLDPDLRGTLGSLTLSYQFK